MIACAVVALDIARHFGRGVVLVDVNRPGEQQKLVDRYVVAEQIFPLLVRPNEDRLEGPEDFVPGRLRRFIKGA